MRTCTRCGLRNDGPAENLAICDTCLLEETLQAGGASGSERFGSYQVLCELGEGGLGIVYLAQQSQPIRREVALKALKTDVSGREGLARFESERQTLASLDHPSIAHVYDAGTSSAGRPFLVMEYVEGNAITRYCDDHRLGLRERVALLEQVCDAVEYAHRHGVVHRDLKPPNILVTEGSGAPVPKVIDFGIAKSLGGSVAGNALRTAAGELLGTLEYMSPEQAQALGKDAAPAADIYSLGVVLYELLCGALPFDSQCLREGGLIAGIRILSEQEPPAMSARLRESAGRDQVARARRLTAGSLERELAGDLEAIVGKALKKQAQERYQSAAALSTDLWRYRNQMPVAAHPPGVWYRMRKGIRKRRAVLAIAAMGAVAAVLPWFLATPRSTPPRPKWTQVTSYPGYEVQPALSPDGSRLAFAWNGQGGNYDIYVQATGASNPTRLTSDPAFDQHPSWSPDGRQIAFLRTSSKGGEILTVPSGGGAERHVADIALNEDVWGTRERSPGPAWSPDGASLAVGNRIGGGGPMGLELISLADGSRRRLTSPGNDTMGDSMPAFSPDGRTVAFVRSASRPSVADVYLVPTAGGEARRLTFDRKELLGLTWISGRELVIASVRSGPTMLWKVPVKGGAPEEVPIAARAVRDVNFGGSPPRLVLVEFFTQSNLWRLNLKQAGAQPERLAATTRRNHSPKYSPDGKAMVFVSDRSGPSELWVAAADGSNARRITSFGGAAVGSPRWAPDSRQIVFDGVNDGHSAIFVVAAAGGVPRRLTQDSWQNVMPSWSRDGRSIYFGSTRSGERLRVWKMAVDGGAPVQITHAAGGEPVESADGRVVYFSDGVNGVWQVSPDGHDEHPVPGLEHLRHSRYFDLTARGAYFLRDSTAPGELVFFDFATRQITPLLNLGDKFMRGMPSLSVTGDDNWLLYSEVDDSGSDVLMLESFR